MPRNSARKAKPGRPRRPRAEPDAPTWIDRLVLNTGETLRKAKSTTTGNLAQLDTDLYDVIDAQGQVVGGVVHTTAISLKPPFVTRNELIQTNLDGSEVLRARW